MKRYILLLLCAACMGLTGIVFPSIVHAQVWNYYTVDNSFLPSDRVHDIVIDQENRAWIGTEAGLASFDRARAAWQVYTTANSNLPDDYITSLAVDDDGSIWIGTDAGGLAHYDSAADTWRVYTAMNSPLPANHISTIAIDGRGVKWIGSYSWLATFDGIKWAVFNAPDSGLPLNQIQDIAFDSTGTAWIGTLGGGLVQFDGTDGYAYDTAWGLPDQNVRAIAVDGSDNKWIGTDYGLAFMRVYLVQSYTTENSGLPADYVRAVTIDKNGIVWIGAGGIVKYDGSTWTAFTPFNTELPSAQISALASDANATLWAATLDRGVVTRNDNSTTTTTAVPDGICPAQAVLGDQASELQALYAFRDLVLAKSMQGVFCITMYYRHAPEVTGILRAHPELAHRVRVLVTALLPVLAAAIDTSHLTVSEDMLQQSLAVLEGIAVYGSPQLQKDLVLLARQMRTGSLLLKP